MGDTGIYPSTDSYNHFSENYPYNVIPQVKSIQSTVPSSILTCPPDFSLQSIVFEGDNLVVIKGSDWKTKFELKNFFEIVNSFSESEIILRTAPDESKVKTIDLTNIQYDDTPGIKFISIFPQFFNLENTDQSSWKLHIKLQNDENWKPLGRIFVWSALYDEKITKIQLKNNMEENVFVKILMGV